MMGKIYPVELVGESNYQDAIRRCQAGDTVSIRHEADNRYDGLALVVETAAGATIGYIAKSSWLRDAIHEQGRDTASTIRSIHGEGDLLGVVLDVTLA
jgi:hypothetical protein